LSEDRKKAGAAAAVDHAVRHVVRHPDGGFDLQAAGRKQRVVSAEGGWSVEGDAEFDGWWLRRARVPGFVLQGKEGDREVARTMPPVGTATESGLRFLLLEDGRLFRIVLRGPRNGRYELMGWETTGPYLTARPEAEGWRLEPTSACGGLDEIRVLCLMLAAEVLDAEDALREREP